MSLMLVDIATVYYRAYFSQPDWEAPNGEPANAIRGTLDALTYMVDKYRPEHLVTAWDAAWRPEWRVELLPSYKTARVASEDEEQMPDTLSDQVDRIKQVLTSWGVPCVGVEDYESDDVVAQYSRSAKGQVFIVSGDRDLFQLVDDTKPAQVLYIGTGISKHTKVDGNYLIDKYGISYSQYGDFSVLRGDASDGLPGVSGVGEKTAAKLLQDFGDLAGVLRAANAADPGIRPRIANLIIESEEYLQRAQQVVLLNQEIKVPPVESNWKSAQHSELIEELGLARHQRAWHSAIDY
jgi:5'-3' exonuclease